LAERFLEFIVSDVDTNKRLDIYLSQNIPDLSRNRVQSLIEDGYVRVNEKTNNIPSSKVKEQTKIDIKIPAPVTSELAPAEIPLDIRYEDPHLLVINKPAGMVVHPGAGKEENTLVNALLFYCKDLSGIGGIERPGIVHRLDKDTTGLLIVAKDDITHRELSKNFKERTIQKTYYTITHGIPASKEGVIKSSIGRHLVHRKKMCVSEKNSRDAITIWRALELFKKSSFLEIDLKTGRTHQIRVHLSSTGHAILGDVLYGGQKKIIINGNEIDIKRCMLHAGRLIFTHPLNNKIIEIKAELPDDMQNILYLLRHESQSKA